MPPPQIQDAIADDTWAYKHSDGSHRTARVIVGRPRPIPGDLHGDWSCPIYFEGVTEGVLSVNGVGPVDALMNAMKIVGDQFNELREVTPRAKPAPP